jgi:hypothetical protein
MGKGGFPRQSYHEDHDGPPAADVRYNESLGSAVPNLIVISCVDIITVEDGNERRRAIG